LLCPFALFFFWFFLMFASLKRQRVRNARGKLSNSQAVEEWVALLMARVLLIDLKSHQMLEENGAGLLSPVQLGCVCSSLLSCLLGVAR